MSDISLKGLAVDNVKLGDNASSFLQNNLLLEQEAKIAQGIDDSSWADKALAFDDIYKDNSIIGYNEKQLSGETKQSDDDFDAEAGFKVNPEMAFEMALQAGGGEDMADKLLKAKSQKHLSYLFSYESKQIEKQKNINATLSSGEQMFAQVSAGVFDWDTLFTAGLSAVPKIARVIGSVSRATALASSVGFSKPFVRDYLQEADSSALDRIIEGVVGGVVEGVAVKYFSPEIKDSLNKAITSVPTPAGINAIQEGSDIVFKGDLTPKPKEIIPQAEAKITEGSVENQVIKEYKDLSVEDLSVKVGSDDVEYTTMMKNELDSYLANNSELLLKDKEFMKHMNNGDYESALTRADDYISSLKAPDNSFAIPRPKELDEEADALDLLEETVSKELGDKFNRELFNSELTIQVENKNNFFEMMNSLKKYVQTNNINTDKAKIAIKEAKQTVDSLIEDVSSIVPLSAKDKKIYSTLFKQELDDFLTTSKDSSKLSLKQKASAFIDSLKKDKVKLLENVKKVVATQLKKLYSEVDSLTKEVKELEKAGKKVPKTKLNKIASAQKKATKLEEEELSRIEKELNSASDKLKVTREGDFIKLGRYKIPLALGVVTMGSSAFAEGEGDSTVSGFFSLFLLMAGTGVGISLLKNANKTKLGQKFSTLLDGSERKTANLQETAKTRSKVIGAIQDSHDTVRSGLTETYAPLERYAKKSGNIRLLKAVKNLLFNGESGEQSVAEIAKSKIIHTEIPRYIREEKEAFAEWKKANNITSGGEFIAYIKGESTVAIFREYVAMHQAGLEHLIPKEGIEAVSKMSKNSSAMKERVLDMAKELGVEGTEGMKMVDNYLTRRYNSRIRDLLIGAESTTEGMQKLKKSFYEMYHSGVQKLKNDATKITKSLQKTVDGFADMKAVTKFIETNSAKFDSVIKQDSELEEVFVNFKNSKSVEEAKENYIKFAKEVEALDSVGKTQSKIDKYLENMKKEGFINDVADEFSSLKYRIPLDLKAFREFSMVVDGEQVSVKLNSLFDLDDFALTERYVSSLAGRIGVKNAGFQISELNDLINDLPANEKMIMGNVLNVLTGKPTYMLTTNEAKVMQGISNLTSARLLVTSPVSLIMEATMAVTRSMKYGSEGRKLLNDIFSGAKDMGEDSIMLRAFANEMGFGVGSRMGGANIRGEALDMFDSDLRFSKGLNYTRMIRDLVMNNKMTGISYWSDKIELINTSLNTQRLADIAYGKTTLSDLWMTKYGISPKDYSFIKRVLKYNDKGFVKYPEVSKLSNEDQLRLHNMLFNMNQYGAQRSTIGGTPHWAYSSSVGALFIKLLSYSVNSVSNLGAPQLKGVATGDVDAFLGMSSVFAGGYLSAKARDAIMGRPAKTEEEYMQYAVMQIPILAPISLGMALANPTVAGGLDSLGNDLGNTASFISSGNF